MRNLRKISLWYFHPRGCLKKKNNQLEVIRQIFCFKKENINTVRNFLEVLEFEEGKEDDREYKRIDELSKYIEVIKINKNSIYESKYYGYDFENEEKFFDKNGELQILPEQVRKNEIEKEYIHVPPFVLTKLCEYAFKEILFFLNKKHLNQLKNILNDNQSSKNDKYVAMTLIKNAVISAEQNLPGCQDTGTAIILGKKDEEILTTFEHKYLNLGVYNAYKNNNFRYSQLSPIDMFNETNTKNNLPCQIEIYSSVRGKKYASSTSTRTSTSPPADLHLRGPKFELIFIAKGGGSANKTFLFQQTKSILNEDKLYEFLLQKIKEIGTSACPPYHLAIVIGGLSAEMNLKTVKLASCRYIDNLKKEGGIYGKAFRDIKSEKIILEKAQKLGIGAQFGGKYFLHDVRVIRLPRHSASCPIGIGVSCSADRQIKCVINREGVFIEALEHEPIKYLPEVTYKDLNQSAAGQVHSNLGHMESSQMGSSQMESSQMGSSQMGSSQMGSSQMGSSQMGSSQMGSSQMGSSQKGSSQMGSSQMESNQMESSQMESSQMESNQMESSQMESNQPGEGVQVDLNKPMKDILSFLSKYPVSTLLLLTGKLIVARDTAHKRIVDDFVQRNVAIPEYFKKYPIYYAGPAKTPDNYASGSFGPTTAGRMDAYAEILMKNEASLISLAKGNRSYVVKNACKKYNGFYLGSIGGPGAILAKQNIKKVQVIDFPELGMEAVHLIEVVDFPAFIVIDNKGNDFYNRWIPS